MASTSTPNDLKYATTPLPSDLTSAEFGTIMGLWAKTIKNYPSKVALKWKKVGETAYTEYTWLQYYNEVLQTARGFIRLGLEPKKGVCILGFNCKEWFVADYAAIFAGGNVSGVYTTNTPEQCQYIAANCNAQIVVLENDKQLEKFLNIRYALPDLKAIVLMSGTTTLDVPDLLARGKAEWEERVRNQPPLPEGSEEELMRFDGSIVDEKLVYTWEELQQLGNEVTMETLQQRIDAQKPDDVCTLIYTSGTTGNPKGVMLSHKNITFTAASLIAVVNLNEKDSMVSYLPLSHIAEQMVSLHGPLAAACTVWFADTNALRGTLVETMKDAKPTIFLGVPRVWEKFQEKMMAAGEKNQGFKKSLISWAKGIGLEGGYAEQQGKSKPWGWFISETLVFNKVKQALGLDYARMCVTSAAPISKGTLEFFLSLGIPICEVFGMSELTGPATISLPQKYTTTKCGFPIPGTEVKIADDGEVCVRGPHVCVGYLKRPKATGETIDEEGWLHTGDIGTLDARGFLQITDRKKELIITAGGENVAPAIIEGMIRGIPSIGQAVVIGDRRKFLTALITLNPERLAQDAAAAGSDCGNDMVKAAACPKMNQYIMNKINSEVNKNLAQVQTIKKITILPAELSTDNDELTPTMKLKRRVINAKYSEAIETMYAGSE